ncbi:MAG: hypothetical protein AAF127_09850 [Pseudomonadota bacterium]
MINPYEEQIAGHDIRVDAEINQEERTPCLLLIDVSGSMNQQGKIDQINEGLKSFEAAIKADATTASRVVVSVVIFGTKQDNVQIVEDWTDAEYFVAPTLTAWGKSPMGEAVDFALQRIESIKEYLVEEEINYKRPWIFLLSDGGPTDEDWYECAQRASAAVDAKKVMIWALVTDPGDPEGLRPFVGTGSEDHNEVYAIDGAALKEMFQWLSTSLGADACGDAPVAPGKVATG